MKKLSILAILLIPILSIAQDDLDIDIQSYTPSVLLKKGSWEYKFFNNLYTQTEQFDQSRTKSELNQRANYFSSINQFLYGLSPKVNVGFDLWIKSVKNNLPEDLPFEALKFQNSNDSRWALTGIGPKIKVAPFQKIPKLSIQSTLLFPVAPNLEGGPNQPYLSENSIISYTQFFYDKSLGNKFQLFFQVAPWVYYKVDTELTGSGRWAYSNPVSVFASFFATSRVTVYLQNEFWPSFGENGIESWFIQEGIGLKYQIVPGFLEGEALYTKFIAGKNQGAGQTLNFGLRFIR